MNIDGLYNLTRRGIIERLIQDGPVSYRTLGFGLWNHQTPKWKPKSYFELTPEDYPEKAARRTVSYPYKKGKPKWRRQALSIGGSPFPTTYTMSLQRKNYGDDDTVVHEDGLAAIFFAYFNSRDSNGNPSFLIKRWYKPPRQALVIERENGTHFKHLYDRYIVLDQKDAGGNWHEVKIYLEYERTRKESSRVKDELDWGRVAYHRGGILEDDSHYFWITGPVFDKSGKLDMEATLSQRDWLMSHANADRMPPNIHFVTFPEILADPLTADYRHFSAAS